MNDRAEAGENRDASFATDLTLDLALDHVVILVKDLAQAMEEYSRSGFSVTPGGEHAGGLTHNALVPFEDGTYLELLAFKSPSSERLEEQLTEKGNLTSQPIPDLWRRFQRRRALGEGLVDFALSSEALEADLLRISRTGLEFTGPAQGARTRPDGQELRWLTALPPSFDLPFLIQDQTPRALRVPGGAATRHPNGARGIARVVVRASDLLSSTGRYDRLLGGRWAEAGPAVESASGAEYKTRNATIAIAEAPAANPTEWKEEAMADRPWSVDLISRNPLDSSPLALNLGGARINFGTGFLLSGYPEV